MEESEALARTIIRLAEKRGVRTTAFLTDMDAPLGAAVGNGLEAREAFRCLGGNGPQDLSELSASLVGEMLALGGVVPEPKEGYERATDALSRGVAVDRMARLVEAQGGDPGVVATPESIPSAPFIADEPATSGGWVQEVRPRLLGLGVVELGGGRRHMDDDLDPTVGFVLGVRRGSRVEAGEPLGQVHARDPSGLERGREILRDAVVMGPEPPSPPGPIIRARLSSPS
jgi:pyrimidine-nucleoside phosphorylase